MAIRNFDNLNNQFNQTAGGASVRGDTFNFLGGNDRLILARNDDFAGLGGGPSTFGTANMGDGRDVVITSFNMSGTFNLGNGNDFFLSEGNESLSFTDLLVNCGAGNDLVLVATNLAIYNGDAGNDVFVSDGSNNDFFGGDGNDTYSAEAADNGATIDLLNGQAFARFVSQFDDLDSIENARGTGFSDIIQGNNGNNRLDGLAGSDEIGGLNGNDTISGGGGVNDLFGDIGTDTLVVQGTITSRSLSGGLLTISGNLNGVTFTHRAQGFEQVLDNGVLKSVNFFMTLTATNTVVQTVIGETPTLGAINGFIAGKTLNGNANPNAIDGGVGFDDIAGFGNNDTLRGFAGEDHINGGAGNDTIEGGDGADTLVGDIGNDTIRGGNGNDVIMGNGGNDTLTGGANNDFFFFTSPLAGNADTVTDYNVAQDGIRIDSAVIGGLADGALAAIRFKNTALGALDGDDRIVYNSANGNLLFDSNGSGAGGQALIADLASGLAMTAAEIFVI